MKGQLPSSVADRRALLMAIAGCLAAAVAMLLASGQVWLEVALAPQPPLPGVSRAFTGGEVVDLLVPISILVGAAGLALIATRRVGRLVVASIVVLAGLLVLVAVGFFVYDEGSTAAYSWAQAYAAAGESVFPDREVSVMPAVLALVAGVIALASGLLSILGSRRWPVMGARYEPRTGSVSGTRVSEPSAVQPAAPANSSPPANEAAMWAALERGEDPTAASVESSPDDATTATRDQPVPPP